MIEFKNPYFSNKMKVSILQRAIIIYSIIYYELDESVVTDRVFDFTSKQLVKLMKETSEEELKQTEYWYCMFDYDGSTGFHLYGRLIESDKIRLMQYARMVLDSLKKSKQSVR